MEKQKNVPNHQPAAYFPLPCSVTVSSKVFSPPSSTAFQGFRPGLADELLVFGELIELFSHLPGKTGTFMAMLMDVFYSSMVDFTSIFWDVMYIQYP